MEKLKLTHTKKLKPGLVTSYDIQPGNKQDLFWCWCFINLSLTYLLRHLPTYSQPRDTHVAAAEVSRWCDLLVAPQGPRRGVCRGVEVVCDLLVAPMMKTFFLLLMPSISVSS